MWLAPAHGQARPLAIEDMVRIHSVDSPTCSSDGNWIAYTVSHVDPDADELRTTIWLVDWSGREHVQLTSSAEKSTNPKLSPDGRYVSFLSARGGRSHPQLFLMDRRGGEARAITPFEGEIQDYDWSPDSRRIVISAVPRASHAGQGDAAKGAGESASRPQPIVVDRLRFKDDDRGYLGEGSRAKLYVLELDASTTQQITHEAKFDDHNPVWSPDGRAIAFVSGRDSDPDRTNEEELYVMEPASGAPAHRIARLHATENQHVLWTNDGRSILFLEGADARNSAYAQERLAVAMADGSGQRLLAPGLDRAVRAPLFVREEGAADLVGVLVADDGAQYPAVLSIESVAKPRRLLESPMLATDQCSAGGHLVVAASTDAMAPELFAVEGGQMRKITHHNDALMADVQLGAVRDIAFRGADREEVHGLLVEPPGYQVGNHYPTIIWLHGGPTGQDAHGLPFDKYPLQLERQWFAAHGYVVLGVNYHGSSGRGDRFARALTADWGHREVIDVLAGADFAVSRGIADPDRLGIGGWSYGGITTDYVIASDTRFKAAISGAGSANQLSMYGSDEYITEYNAEIEPPWIATDRWLRISYAFFHADRIRTPTLFLGGDRDFNVPLAGGEQMYQALRTNGIPTQLIVYPGQSHLLDRPSFIRDRLERYLSWFDRYLR